MADWATSMVVGPGDYSGSQCLEDAVRWLMVGERVGYRTESTDPNCLYKELPVHGGLASVGLLSGLLRLPQELCRIVTHYTGTSGTSP